MLTITIFIISMLLSATLFVEYQLASHYSIEARKNRLRIRTWWVICSVCIPVFYIGGWAITILVYCLIYWSAFEFSKLLNLRINVISVVFFTFSLFGYHFLIRTLPDYLFIFFMIPFLVFLMLLVVFQWFSHISTLKNLLVLMLCMTSVFSIILVKQQSDVMEYNAGLVILFVFLMAAANDIFQYICGKKFGRRPLAKKISQHKTLEGALGGVLLTIALSSMTMPYVIQVNELTAGLIGGAIAILGIVGDLNISHLKRRANVKDSGALLPGHGGLLDRIDSLTLIVPGFGIFLILISKNLSY